jgi:GntR family transcriptional regulator
MIRPHDEETYAVAAPPYTGHPRAQGGSAGGRQKSPRRVRDLISLSIRLGYLSPDDPLVEHELMTLFDTSRTSIRAALAQLTEDGMIERRPRTGTRINAVGLTIPLADNCTVDQLVTPAILEDRLVPNFPLARDRLRIEDEQVRMVENSFTFQGSVIGIRTAYFGSDLVMAPDTINNSPTRMEDILGVTFQTRPGEVDVIVGAGAADTKDARLMGIAEGMPLLIREMTYYAHDGSPVEIVFDRFRCDRVHIGGKATL